MIESAITVPLRYPPHIAVEELERDDVVVRIVSTPANPSEGSKLAEEVLSGVRADDGHPDDEVDGRRHGDGNGGSQPTIG